MAYIMQQEEKIYFYVFDEFNYLQDNFFVYKDYSEVVICNLEEVCEVLEQLKLCLEKVQYVYINIQIWG